MPANDYEGVNKWSLPYCSAPCRKEISKVRSLRKLPRESHCGVSEQTLGVGCIPEQSGGDQEKSDSVPSRITTMSKHRLD